MLYSLEHSTGESPGTQLIRREFVIEEKTRDKEGTDSHKSLQ